MKLFNLKLEDLPMVVFNTNKLIRIQELEEFINNLIKEEKDKKQKDWKNSNR